MEDSEVFIYSVDGLGVFFGNIYDICRYTGVD